MASESVWDYPRPPRLVRTESEIRIVHCGVPLAHTTRAYRILETSHPPVFYLPMADIAMQYLKPSSRRRSFCEFKGFAEYWTVDVTPAPGRDADCNPLAEDCAWSYPKPSIAYAELRDHLAFYSSCVSECTVDGEVVTAQPGDFYGGWITSNIRGPFKGPPGTLGW